MNSGEKNRERKASDDSSHDGATSFRRADRKPVMDLWYGFRRSLTPLNLLPLAIIALGTGVIFMTDPGRTDSAIITLITACLSGLSIYVKALFDYKNQMHHKRIQNRFEELEDRAWELHESEERYRKVAEAFGDLIVVTDADGKITYCNKAFENLFKNGIAGAQKLGDLPDVLVQQLEKAKKASGPTEICITSEKTARWFQWEEVPIRDDRSGGMGTLSVARDITAFKRSSELDHLAREQAEEASRMKTRFLAMASHEMRTPLNGIIGMSKLLENTGLDPEQKNYATSLKNSGENLLELINSMLDLTMIEAGKFEVKNEAFSFNELMTTSIELLSSRAYAKQIECGLFIDPSIPETLETDKGRLRQIVFNLVGNAIKFTQSGGVQVRCHWVEGKSDNGARLKIEVKDSGPGLSVKDKKRIFSEFERVDDEITRNTDGAGLGLSISKALAEQLDGRLQLAKTSKAGSTFTLEIPISRWQAAKAASAKCDLTKHKVLIISSGQDEAQCLADTIQSQGGFAQVVGSYKQASTLLKNKKFSATEIIIDTEFDAVSHEKMTNALPEDVRMIFTTLPANKSRLKDHERFMDGWLVRPIRNESLLLVLAGESSEPDTTTEREATPSKQVGFGKKPAAKILLAEDNDINALLATAALKRANVEVCRAMDGEDAVSQFRKSCAEKECRQFDMILMDMHMPVMDGLGAIEKIRKLEKKRTSDLQPVPIYVLTADELPETQKNALKAGASGYLVKPVDPDALCKLVLENQTEGSTQRKAG